MKFITIMVAVCTFSFNAYSSRLANNSLDIDKTIKQLICSTTTTEVLAAKKLGDLIVELDVLCSSLDRKSLQRKQLDTKRDYVNGLQRIFVKGYFASNYSVKQYCSGENYTPEQEHPINEYSYFVELLEEEIQAISDDELEVVTSLGDMIVELDNSRGSLTPSSSLRLKLDDLRNHLSDLQLELIKGDITSSMAKAKALEHGVER